MFLKPAFYERLDVVRIAQELIGKCLTTSINGKVTSGWIVETEAYSRKEKGCHAYKNRKTSRNEVMFRAGGHAYVYLCYGIHQMFNVVTNREGEADAVLIRALEPDQGVELMMSRSKVLLPVRITSGPGKLTKALGIGRSHNGLSLQSDVLWIDDKGRKVPKKEIRASPRIGIDYAGKDALLPWRFTWDGNPWISRTV